MHIYICIYICVCVCMYVCMYTYVNELSYHETSGSHCAVRLGHSRACVITKSYRKGVFFFQILYSSLITFSSIVSSISK